MRMVYLSNEQEVQEFAKRAAKHFSKNKNHWSYTNDEIKAGCLFAMRFGLTDDCVVVFKLDENFDPVNYCQLIQQI